MTSAMAQMGAVHFPSPLYNAVAVLTNFWRKERIIHFVAVT